jgi:hypothetical protein
MRGHDMADQHLGGEGGAALERRERESTGKIEANEKQDTLFVIRIIKEKTNHEL